MYGYYQNAFNTDQDQQDSVTTSNPVPNYDLNEHLAMLNLSSGDHIQEFIVTVPEIGGPVEGQSDVIEDTSEDSTHADPSSRSENHGNVNGNLHGEDHDDEVAEFNISEARQGRQHGKDTFVLGSLVKCDTELADVSANGFSVNYPDNGKFNINVHQLENEVLDGKSRCAKHAISTASYVSDCESSKSTTSCGHSLMDTR